MPDFVWPKAFILDCDGTLVDSEAMAANVSVSLFKKLGVPMTEAEAEARYIGMALLDILMDIRKNFNVDVPADSEGWVRALFLDNLSAQPVTCLPETVKVLTQIKAMGIKLCVASNGDQQVVEREIAQTPLAALLPPEIIFTKDLVVNPKPAPDLFLFAAAKLGIMANDCWVIEDTVTGVKAACAAGMRALGYVGFAHDKEKQAGRLRAAGASKILRSFVDIAPNL